MADVVVVPDVVPPHVDETPTVVPHTTVVPNTSTMVHTAPPVAANNGNIQAPMWFLGIFIVVFLLAVVGFLLLLDRN